jgi:hypothetical protein
MRFILCVYSCQREPYARLRKELLAQDWFQSPLKDPSIEVFFVYADPHCREPTLSGMDLFLPCEDAYAQLASKTLRMLEFFSRRGGFDYLIKMDDSILASPLSGKLPSSIVELCHGSYCGIRPLFTLPITSTRWFQERQLPFRKQSYPWFCPFYAGKLYTLSWGAVAAIAQYGRSYEETFNTDLGGIEDVLVGRVLLQHYLSPREKFQIYASALRSELRVAFQQMLSIGRNTKTR